MELEELSQEKRLTTTNTERRSRKRKRSKSPGLINNLGSAKKSQNEPFDSFPKLNSRGAGSNGEESNGSGSKSSANGRKRTGQELDKLPIIQEKGKPGSKLPNLNLKLKKNSSCVKQGSVSGEDTEISPELLVLPHVKPDRNSKVAKPPKLGNPKNVWE